MLLCDIIITIAVAKMMIMIITITMMTASMIIRARIIVHKFQLD